MKFSVPSFALGMLLAAVTIAYLYWPVEIVAAPPTTSDNCTTIGTVGSVIVARCVDPDSDEAVWANSVGFIDVVED